MLAVARNIFELKGIDMIDLTRRAVVAIWCATTAIVTTNPATAQELQAEYELCLVSKFIDRFSSGTASVSSFLDVENLLVAVAPDCEVERYKAAFEHVEIMVDTNDLTNVNMDEVAGEVEKNTILDLSVELHTRMF